MTTITAMDLPNDPQVTPPNPLRVLTYSVIALTVGVLAVATLTAPADAGSCTGIAALEAPLLPVIA